MKKRKFTKKEIIVLSVLIVMMVAVVTVGAFLIAGNVNMANKLANTENTTIDITMPTTRANDTSPDATEKNASNTKLKSSKKSNGTKSDSSESNSRANSDSKNSKTSSDSKTNSRANSRASSGTGSKTNSRANSGTNSSSSKTSSKSKSNSGAKEVPLVTPETNPTHASRKVCAVNGKKCYVGDEITVALNLRAPRVLVNYQGYTSYDSSYLDFVSKTSNAGGLVNEHNSVIYYNNSMLGGIDFTSMGTIYTATFKVKKEGSTTIDNVFEVITDMKDVKLKESDCDVSLEIFD